MYGYWRASVNGAEVARGSTPDEAYEIATKQGNDPNQVVLEYVYEQGRVGLNFIQ